MTYVAILYMCVCWGMDIGVLGWVGGVEGIWGWGAQVVAAVKCLNHA